MLPNDLKYTKEHEWVKVEGENIFIGITDYAQSELGDIVFVELPDIGDSFDKDEAMGTIEAVKTVADIFCPIAGEVVEVNQEIENSPELVNTSPYNDGWLINLKMVDSASLVALLSSDEYKEIIS